MVREPVRQPGFENIQGRSGTGGGAESGNHNGGPFLESGQLHLAADISVRVHESSSGSGQWKMILIPFNITEDFLILKQV
jgi:hypothetical protein